MEWKSALIRANSTIQQAIKNLDDSALQIALAVAEDGTLIGTITDGDIRRALLRGFDLNSPIESIINRNSLVVPPHLGREMIRELMQANKIHQLPVVDEARKVVGLHLLDEILAPTNRQNLFIVMAGGKGVRLRPHTENCPKPMLPIGGKPMLEHIIEKAKSEGFRHFLISLFYLGHMIEEYFGDGADRGIRIEYVRENSPLGTAGALGLIRQKPTESFIVTNGDVMTDIRYSELLDFHGKHAAAATMSVRLHEWQHPFGVVRTKGVDILGFEEKPLHRSHVNAGIYALRPEALSALQPGEVCDMPTLFTRLSDAGKRIIVYPMHEPWIDVGREEDLARIRGLANTDSDGE